jgi:ATP-dependent exoDNAse (exonuclease V) alpha subunit
MIKEHDRIVLTIDVPEEGLRAGDVGTVVHVHKRDQAYEVEFVALDGETVTVATLRASEVRPIAHREIAHARPMSA